MGKWWMMISCAVMALTVAAAELPYDEHANADAQLQQALTQARTEHRDILVIFGANWCEDCRALDRALHGSSQALIANHFELVKVDIGNFDKNLEIAHRYGNPIGKGIPAVVVLSPSDQVLYSTKAGELANARRMGDNGIYDFLSHNISSH